MKLVSQGLCIWNDSHFPSHYFPFLTEPLPKDFLLLLIMPWGSVGPLPTFPSLPVHISPSSRSFLCPLQAHLTFHSLKSLPLCPDWEGALNYWTCLVLKRLQIPSLRCLGYIYFASFSCYLNEKLCLL